MMRKSVYRVAVRLFSTPAPPLQITPELIAKNAARIEKYSKFMQPSLKPKTFQVHDSGRQLQPVAPEELATLSGIPLEHQSRTVIIEPFHKKTMQSGEAKSHFWQIQYKTSDRWKNPLMGWTSTADTMTQLNMVFDSKDEAIAFAKSNGMKYELRSPVSTETVPVGTMAYADNFLPRQVMNKVRAEGLKCQHFKQSGFGHSHWFMPLKFHGDGEVDQHGDRVKN